MEQACLGGAGQSPNQTPNPKKERHLRDWSEVPTFAVAQWWTRFGEGQLGVRLAGASGEWRKGSSRTSGDTMNLVITTASSVKPVACFTRPDPAPRGAVRRVGPRPDPTRSAWMSEPARMAIRVGNRSSRPRIAQLHRADQPCGGGREENGSHSGFRLRGCSSDERPRQVHQPVRPFGFLTGGVQIPSPSNVITSAGATELASGPSSGATTEAPVPIPSLVGEAT
jgi:hypothetical protein